MSNWYQILSGFLERFGDQVEGRGREPLTPELKAELQLFAQGKLSETAQKDLVERLLERPDAVEFLADTIKARRAGPAGAPESSA